MGVKATKRNTTTGYGNQEVQVGTQNTFKNPEGIIRYIKAYTKFPESFRRRDNPIRSPKRQRRSAVEGTYVIAIGAVNMAQAVDYFTHYPKYLDVPSPEHIAFLARVCNPLIQTRGDVPGPIQNTSMCPALSTSLSWLGYATLSYKLEAMCPP